MLRIRLSARRVESSPVGGRRCRRSALCLVQCVSLLLQLGYFSDTKTGTSLLYFSAGCLILQAPWSTPPTNHGLSYGSTATKQEEAGAPAAKHSEEKIKIKSIKSINSINSTISSK